MMASKIYVKAPHTKDPISKVTLPDHLTLVQYAMDVAVRFAMGIIIKDLRHIMGLEITQYARIKLLWELIDRLEEENGAISEPEYSVE